MNKNRYRIIFSHARGMFIAVAEIVKSKTKQAGQSQGTMETGAVESSVSPIHYKKLNPLNFAVIGCLGALVISLPMSSVAGTQIVVDKGAPTSQQPTILNSANGTTQVNIQTPSAGGVSRNTYTQFDVGQEGAILNNSRNNTQTQIGGWVQGNPWLAKGEAKVILNEVNSSNPSQLQGYIEVAGKQAQVVIANPSGLICDGCGVINADRFTLTTGQAVMNQGYLESFRVREGQVTIEGKGLNGSLTPYTDIYARALKVNAGLYANELNTVLGQNDIQVKDQVAPQITATTAATTTLPPNFALDVGQLGGMYAGKIFLVGTEQGLGVRNAGSINSTQSSLTLNANGDLVNSGNLIANKDQVQLKAQNIQNTGNISSATSQISVESQNLNNSGLISSADELHLQNQNTITNSGTLNAARIAINSTKLKNSGSIEQTGLQGLDLKSGSMTNLGGKIGIATSNTGGGTGGSTGGSVPTVPTDPSKDGGSLGVVTPVDTTPKTYDTGFIHVSDVLNNDQGAIVANGGVDVESQNGLDNQGGQLNLGAINIKGNSFNNNQGQLNVKSANIQTSSFTNQQGQLASNSSLNIQSQSANNKGGKIQSIGQLDLAVTGELNNVDGQIASGATVNVTASNLKNQSGVVYSENQAVNIKANKAIDNTEGLIQAKTNLNLNSQSLNNTAGQIVADQINQKHVTVNNNQGTIAAQQNLNSTAQQFDNTQGQIQAKSIKLQHDQFKNTGSVYADQDLTISGKTIQNSGSLAAGENVQITSSALEHAQDGLIAAGLNREGKVGDTGDLTISVDQAGLHGQTFAGGNIQVDATGKIDAAQGQLQSKTIALNAGTDISTQAATVVAQDQLKLTSQNLINNQQGLLSSQDLILTAKQLDNSQGKIQHTGTNDLNLQFANGLNNKAGEISSNASSINLNTSALNNEAGKIIHAGNQQLNITADQLQGAQGQILSNGQLLLKGGQVLLDGATTSANQINLTANSLSHQKGQMIQRGTLKPLTLAVKEQINNQSGLIQSPTALYITSGSLNNQGGQLSSAQGHNLNLQIQGLMDNSQAGKIYAGQDSIIQAGAVDNRLDGLISAQNALTLTSLGVIDNQSGKIIANRDVGISSNGLDNTSGQIGSVQGGLTLDAGTGKLSNQSGSLQADKNIQIKADQLKNDAGLINTQGAIKATLAQDIDNSVGQIVANQSIQLNSQGLNNNAGQIGSVTGNVLLDAGSGDVSNQSGKVLAAQDLTVKAQLLDNQSGLISAQKHVALHVQGLNNLKGQIQSGNTLEIESQSLSNQSGSIEANTDLTLNVEGTLDNSQSGKLTGNTTQITAGLINNSQQGQINATDTLTVLSKKAINNQTGVMVANQDVSIQSLGLDNTGGQIGSVQGSLTIDAQKEKLLNTSGSLQAGTSLNLTSEGLNNDSGTILALTDNTITSTGDINNKAGKIASNAHTTITSQNLTNQAGTIQSGTGFALDLVINGALDNSQAGQLLSGAGLNLQANALDNSQQGQISAQDALNVINLGLIDNQAGIIVANQNISLNSQGLNNNQGQIGSIQGGLSIDAGNQAFTNQSGVLQAKTDLTAKALSIDSTEGQIISQAKIDLQSQREINNQQGIISANQEVQIKAQGLNNSKGQIGSAQGDVILDAGSDALTNQTGIILSGKSVVLTADRLDNSAQGKINSQEHLSITAAKDINNESSVIAANQYVDLKSQGLNNNQGQIVSLNDALTVNSGTGALDNQSGVLQAKGNIQIDAEQVNSQSGLISSEGGIDLDSQQLVNNTAGQIVANNAVQIKAQGLNNNQGQIASIKDQLVLNSGTGILSNQSGSLQSGQDIQIKADQLKNEAGLMSAQGAIQAQITQDIDNSTGQIVANKAVLLSSQGLNNNAGLIGSVEDIVNIDAGSGVLSNQQGHIQSVKDLTLKAQGIDNQQGVIATQAKLDMQQQWLNNTKGQIISGTTLSFVGKDFNNQGGLLQSGADLNFKLSGLLDNSQSGQLASGGNTVIQAGSVKNSGQGKISAQGVLNINAVQAIDNQSGVMVANQDITLKSQGLNNSQGQIGTKNGSLTIDAGQGQLSNQAGSLQAGTELRLQAAGINNDSGIVGSLGNSHILSSGDISNNAGQIATNATLQVTGQNLTNQAGIIQSGNGSALDLVLNGTLDNSQAGQLLSGAGLNLQVNALDNSQQGQISAQDALNIMSAGLINNQAGSIVANQDVTLNSQGLNNNQGQIGSIQGGLTVDTGNQALSNKAGTLQAKADLTVKALSIDSTEGQIISQANVDLQSQKEINNQQGTISADQGVQIKAQGLNNNLGQIGSAQGNITLNAGQGLLSNQTGKVIAGRALQLSADQVDNRQQGQLNSQTTLDIQTTKDINNQSGVIAANQKVNLNSQGLNNNKGQIVSLNDALSVNSGIGALDNQSGVLQAKSNIQIDAEQVNSQSGLISSEDRIDLQAHQLVDNSSGQIIANHAVQIQSLGLNNNQGQIASVNDVLNINSGSGELQNQGGLLQAQGDIQLTADRLSNQSGLINTQGNLTAQIDQDIDNNAGQIVANQAVQLNSQGLNNNAGQIGSVAGDVLLDAGSGDLSNQSGKIISTQDLTLNAQHVDNQSGLISAQQLILNTQGLNNLKGQIISGTALTFVGQDLNNQGGLLQTNSDLNLNLSGVLDNSLGGQLYSGGSTTVQAASLNNSSQGQISTQDDLNLTTAQEINNAGGIIVASQQMQLKSQGLNNDGGQIGTEQGDLLIETGDLALNNGTGAIQSGKSLSLDVNGLTNSGVISALEQLTISSQGDVNNDHGQILSNKQLQLTGQNLSNQTGIIQSGEQADLDLNINGALNNQTGQIHSGASTQINASSINNSQQGQISAQDALNIISAGLVDNQTGAMVANQDVTLNSQGLNNNQGQIGSVEGELAIDTGNQALSNQAGTLQAKTDIAVKALSVDNTAGQINTQGGIDLVSQQNINNTQGSIVGDQRLNIKAQGLNNNQGQIGTQGDLNLSVGSGPLQNQTGLLQAGQNIIVDAAAIDNSSIGKINAQGNVTLQSTGLINNTTGVIAANQNVTLTSQGLNNTKGQIGSVAGSLNLDSGDQILNNQSGSLLSNNQISIHATGLNNSQGQIVAQQLLDIDAELQALNNQNGLMSSDTVNIISGAFNNDQGLVQAKTSLVLDTNGQNLVNTNSGTQGGLLSQGNLTLKNLGTLDNSKGYVASGQNLSLSADQVENGGGTLLAAQNLKLQGTGQNQLLNNQSGQILSMGDMQLSIEHINNQGKLTSTDADSHIMAAGQLDIQTQQLDNQNTQALTDTDTSVQGIDAGNLNLEASNVNNQSGTIRSSENSQLNISQQLNNQAGEISAVKQLGIQGDQLVVNNLNGQLLAGENLNINVKSLTGDGRVLSLGDANIILKDNFTQTQPGQLQANNNLSLSTVGDIQNDGTINAGNTLKLNASNVNNSSNAKIESHDTQVTAQNQINNTGLINGDLTTLTADTLNNQGTGRIYGTDLAISANTLNNLPDVNGAAPVIASRGDINLGVQTLNNLANTTDYTSQALILSAGNLYLGGALDTNRKATGQATVINNESATIESLGDMRLSATQINNINKHLITDDNVEVSRVDGLEKFCQAWCTFDGQYDGGNWNEDWMRYTYSEITYETRTVESAPGQIKAGGNLDLGGAQVLNDKSQILAGGELKNVGGTIDSGNSLDGIRKVVDQGSVYKHWEYEGDWEGPFEVSSESTFDLQISQALGNQNFSQNPISITAVANHQSGDQVQAGQIQTGHLNDLKDSNASTQVGPVQNAQGQQLNVADTGATSHQVSVQGGQQNLSTQEMKEINVDVDGSGLNVSQAGQASGQDLTIGQATQISNSTQVQSGQQNLPTQQVKDVNVDVDRSILDVVQAEQIGDQHQVIKDTESVTNSSQFIRNPQETSSQQAKDLDITVGQNSQQQGQTASQVSGETTKDQTTAPDQAGAGEQFEIRTVNTNNVKVANNALYRTGADSKAGYLVETDPNFTNYNQWLSSDYMLNALGLDPALQQKRLGDGFYEQRMVQDQIAHLTGYRFLEGYASDDEQYKALMNNGVTFAKQYGLRPGIALSAAQIAQLTSDIVWLVEKDVTLQDGTKTKALVPQVYVKARVGDLKGDGTLLTGDSVNFKLNGDLLNGSTIAGREAVQITADNINNLKGRIQGNTVDITTQKDLNNIGGQISAKDAMAVKVGGNLKIETTTRTSTSQVGDFNASTTGVDRIAGLYVGQGNTIQPTKASLLIDVGGNTVLKAAELNNSNGATVINTVGNVDIGTVQTGYKLSTYRDVQNQTTSQKAQDVGSQLNSNGSLLLNGQNIKVQGSGLNSVQGTTQLSAINQLDIEEGRKTSEFDRQWYEKHKGTLGSKTDTGLTHDQASEAIASTISGKKVLLDANNINIRGSQVVSDELTQIQAKENVNITAAQNQYSNQQEQTVKKSGFKASLSDGVASVGYAKSSLNTKEDGKSTTLAQSVVRSKTGDTTIIAGKDLTTEAAILDAGKDLNLKGANVNLNAAYATDEQHSEVHSKQSGVSVGVTYSPAMAASSAYKNSMNNGQFSDSAVGQVMAQGEAARKASMAAMTPVTIQAGSNKTNQVSNTSSTQAVVTQATAKGNLNIIATEGSINSQGAKLTAEGDALLHAKENINLGIAESHSEQTADRKQSGFSIDNRDWAAPAGTFKNKNQGDGRSTQTTGTQLSVGGKTTLQTGQGDINIIGSSVASKGDVNLNAARDINIKSSQNSQSQSEQSSNKGIGSAQISDTEQFYGYMNGQSQSNSKGVEQQRSQVGSLEGNVNIQAGRQYTQQVADVVAAKDLNIKAQDIQVLEGHDTGSSSENSKDLKIGQFSRVSSPLIDLLNAADKAKNSKADDRTQALQAVAAGAQGYQTYSDIKGGALFKAESGIGFSTNKNQQNSSYATSQQNNLKAGGNVNLTSTNGDIHLQNTQVKAEDKINLDSSKNIILESGQSQNKADGKNSNAGLSVGVGVSVGAQTGAYIYGEAGFGKGSNHLDSNTHSQTTLDAKNISLTSKGDTTLRGAQAKADRIDANVGGQLKVESLQDTVEQNTKQTGAGGRLQASFGTAWQASGNFSSSKASGDSNSVNQQSGLFAGDGGYHVKADSVDLKGGAIVSTATKDKNDLTTNRLTFSNIENQSQYDATTVSLSGGTSLGKGKTGDSKAPTPTNNDNWRNATSFSPSLPQHESDKDSSTTYATLSEGNITIGGKTTTVEQLGIHSNASTANRAVETLPNLQTILDKQKTVADATSTIAAASRTYAHDQIKNAAAEKEIIGQQIASQLSPEEQIKLKGMSAAEKDKYLSQYGVYDAALANEKAVTQQWGMGGNKGRALNAVTTVITGALGGQTDIQVAANALAPYAAQQIGEKFGHGEDKNKAAQLASHAILGATLAYLNGGNPAAGGSAAVASEAAADYFANQYKDDPAYKNGKGEFEPNLLPENVKSSIRDLTAAIGAVVGGTVGDSASNAQLAGVIGKNAVENNEMGFPAIVNSDWASGAESLTKFAKDKNLSQKETQKLLSEYTKGKVPAGYDPVKYYIYLSMGMPAVAFAPESIGIASLGGGVIGAGSDVIVQSANNNPYDWRNTAIAFGVGAITQGKGLGFNIGANVYSEGAKAYLNNESMESAGVKATATTIVSTAMEKVINKKFPTNNSVVKEVLTPAFSSTAVGVASDKLDEKMKEKK